MMRKATIKEWKTLALKLLWPVLSALSLSVTSMLIFFLYLASLVEGEFHFKIGGWLRSSGALFLLLSWLLVTRMIKKSGLKYRGGTFYFKERKRGRLARLFFPRKEDFETETKTSG